MGVKGFKPLGIDKTEYSTAKKLLGEENIPKTLAEFKDLKYNKKEEYNNIRDLIKYRDKVPDANMREMLLYKELKSNKLIKGVVVPYQRKKAYILEDLESKSDPLHIMKRMQERHITDDEVQSFVDNALLVEQQFKGLRLVYYSTDGVTVLTKTNDYESTEWIAKTTWNKTDFDEKTEKLLEAVKKYG